MLHQDRKTSKELLLLMTTMMLPLWALSRVPLCKMYASLSASKSNIAAVYSYRNSESYLWRLLSFRRIKHYRRRNRIWFGHSVYLQYHISHTSAFILQDITAMGRGITTKFLSSDPGYWILDWAEEAVQQSDNGPYVWSISYGFPEGMSFLPEIFY